VVNSNNQAGSSWTDSLVLNSDGSIAKDLSRESTTSGKTIYTYGSGAEVESYVSQYYTTSWSTPEQSDFTFAGGDMIKDDAGTTYTYYDNQSYKAGDYI